MFDELILSINSNIKAQETESQKICLRASSKSNAPRKPVGSRPAMWPSSRFRICVCWDSASAGHACGAQAGAGAAGPGLGDLAVRVGGK